MITAEDATNDLIKIAQGEYTPGATHTCVKEFKVFFPKEKPPAFIPDGLPKFWQRVEGSNF